MTVRSEMASAISPRPDPRTSPTRGTRPDRRRTAASSASRRGRRLEGPRGLGTAGTVHDAAFRPRPGTHAGTTRGGSPHFVHDRDGLVDRAPVQSRTRGQTGLTAMTRERIFVLARRGRSGPSEAAITSRLPRIQDSFSGRFAVPGPFEVSRTLSRVRAPSPRRSAATSGAPAGVVTAPRAPRTPHPAPCASGPRPPHPRLGCGRRHCAPSSRGRPSRHGGAAFSGHPRAP